MTEIAVINQPGLQTTVQDAGRFGSRHLGTPQSGAADRLSLALANAAVGNSWDASALECTLMGPSLTFQTDIVFAIVGADMQVVLNNTPIALYEAILAKPGDVLVLGAAKTGARAYIAFAGGVDGASFLESRSTYLPAQLGGIDGHALHTNDIVKKGDINPSQPLDIPTAMRAQFQHDWILRACDGPDIDAFDEKTIAQFFSTPFSADRRGDRIGVRLVGATITPDNTTSMKSSAVFPGTVQCPPDGAPFLLGADAQTVGGYRRIAQVIDADLPLTGQIRPSDRIWFRRTSSQEARTIATQKASLFAPVLEGFRFG